MKGYVPALSRRQTDTIDLLVLCNSFSLLLIGFRVWYTGNLRFAFLVWNLFLALVPLLLSSWILVRLKDSPRKLWLPSLAWLLFLPNSFYILTDLFHLDMNKQVPLWFDLAVLLSFAGNGLLLGIVSIRQMETVFFRLTQKRPAFLYLLPLMFLNGLGIYIGRYLRFNSWDIISDPLQLSRDLVYLFLHPLRYRFDWSMILCYTILLTLVYEAAKRLKRIL